MGTEDRGQRSDVSGAKQKVRGGSRTPFGVLIYNAAIPVVVTLFALNDAPATVCQPCGLWSCWLNTNVTRIGRGPLQGLEVAKVLRPGDRSRSGRE